MKYRKKPVVIDATQFDGTDESAERLGLDKFTEIDSDSYVWGCKTLEGSMVAIKGDWIITGVKGEKYPCKPDIFEMTYEPVNERPSS